MLYSLIRSSTSRIYTALIAFIVILGVQFVVKAEDKPLYQLHKDGKIWRFTGTPCSGNSCPGWQMLDNNTATKAIAADGTRLYQLHNNGKIWRFTGTPCTGNSCPGWQMIDNNSASKAIVTGSALLYQLHDNG